MSAAIAFKCPGTGEVVRPEGGKCPACGAARMRGHLRLVGREWFLEPEDGQEPPQGVATQPAVEYSTPVRARRQFVTSALLARYRTARAWLVPREPELLACGWNKGKLYRIRPPFGRWYHWGVAWGWGWTLPNTTVAIGNEGAIEFRVAGHDGRLHTMVARPR